MPYTVDALNGCTKKFNFNYESLDLEKEILVELEKKKKEANLKGFRKGKAPLALIRQLYGPQVENEALNRFLQNELIEAIEKENLKPVGYPTIEKSDYDKEKRSLRFEATVETYPEVELKDLKHLTFTKENVEVSEDELGELRKNYLGSKAELVAIEDPQREAKEGDYVILNFEGTKEDGEKPDNMKGEEFQLELGSKTFIPGFEDGIAGMKASEKRSLDLSFPDDYHSEELRQTKVTFDVELLEIKEKNFPELTDDLAKELGFESKSDFEVKSRDNLKAQKEGQAKKKLEEEILKKLIEENPFDVPISMIDSQKEGLKKEITQTLTQQGYNDKMVGEYFEKWDDDLLNKAQFQVKSAIILNKYAEVNNISAQESELDEKYQQMAKQLNMDVAQLKKLYENSEGTKQNLLHSLREERTFEKILEEVTVN